MDEQGKVLSKVEIEELIDFTIIEALEENNIFAKYMTIEEIREKLLKRIHTVRYENLSEKKINGYWNPKANELVLDSRRQIGSREVKETIIHELLHVLTSEIIDGTKYLCGVEVNEYQSNRFCSKGRGMNEGITEWLAQLLCPTQNFHFSLSGVQIDFSGYYGIEQVIIRQLAILYGQDLIIEAYINNHDIAIPNEEYETLRMDLDWINTQKSNMRNSRDKARKKDIQKNILETFIRIQEYFNTRILDEIKNLSTIEEVETFAVKIRKLDQINIKLEEKLHNYKCDFISKCVKIIDEDKDYDHKSKIAKLEEVLALMGYNDIMLEENFSFEIKTPKCVEIEPSGCHEKRYIVDMGVDGNYSELRHYGILREEEILMMKIFGTRYVPDVVLKGKMDLDEVSTNEEYRRFIEENVINCYTMDDARGFAIGRTILRQGYVGEVKTNGVGGFILTENLEHLAYFAKEGFGHETKFNDDNEKGASYLGGLIETGETFYGEPVFMREVLTTDEMIARYSKSKRDKSGETIYIKGTVRQFIDCNYEGIIMAIIDKGGDLTRIESDYNIALVFNDDYVEPNTHKEFFEVSIWKNGENLYLSICDDLPKMLTRRIKIFGNLDIERFAKEAKKRRIFCENVPSEVTSNPAWEKRTFPYYAFLRSCLNQKEIVYGLLSGEIDTLDIIEENGEFKLKTSKHKKEEKQIITSRNDGQDR